MSDLKRMLNAWDEADAELNKRIDDNESSILSTIVASSNASVNNSKTLDFQGTGKNLEKLVIEGKTSQNGTPSPSVPVEVKGVGEKLNNLWNIKSWLDSIGITYTESDGVYTIPNSTSINPATTYQKLNTTIYKLADAPIQVTISGNITSATNGVFIKFMNGSVSAGTAKTNFGTATFIADRVCLDWNSRSDIVLDNISVIEGNGKPYKIPISSGDKSTNIYLDQPLYNNDSLDTEKSIVYSARKLVTYNGSENWQIGKDLTSHFRFDIVLPVLAANGPSCVSSYCPWNNVENQTTHFTIPDNNTLTVYINKDAVNSLDEWKAMLANNPLMVVYTRQNAIEETFDAPEISTIVGKNTLTVGTEVTPTNISVTSFGEYYNKAEVDKMLADKLNKSYASDIVNRITYLTGLCRKNLVNIPSATGNNLVNAKTISLSSGTYVLSYDQTAETGSSSLTLKNGSATTLYQIYSNAKKVKVKFTTAYSNSITIYSAVNTTISNVMIINTANWDEDTPYEPYRLSLQEQIDELRAAIPSTTSEE